MCVNVQRYRAQWNAVESVTMATWSGSAVIGGILVDRYGTGINNIITASLQVQDNQGAQHRAGGSHDTQLSPDLPFCQPADPRLLMLCFCSFFLCCTS